MFKSILLNLILFLGVFSYVHTKYFNSMFVNKQECIQVQKEPKLEKRINILPAIPEKIS